MLRVKIFSIFLIVILISAGFGAYFCMLDGSFKIIDDEASIVKNPQIKDFANLPKIFRGGFFGDRSYYRPLVTLSYMAEYRFFGLNPFFYNLDNLLLHIASGVMVFLIAGMLFKNAIPAFCGALLFIIHPVQWEAVSNIAGRSIVLCAFFFLAAFYAFLLFKEKKKNRFYIASILLFALSLLTKESAVVFPLMIFLYSCLVRGKNFQGSFRESLPFLLVLMLYGFLRITLGMTSLFYWGSAKEMTLGVLTFLRGLITYLRLFILPVDLHFDRMRPVFTHFNDLELLLAAGFLAFLSFFVWQKRSKIDGKILFFLGWFLAGLLPVSQIFQIGTQPGYISLAEHFLYIPSVGIFLCFAFFSKAVFEQGKIFSREAAGAVFGIFLLFLLSITVSENIYAAKEMAMLKKSYAYNRHNVRVLSALSLSYAKQRLFPEAERHFQEALALDPDDVESRIGLGKALVDQGKYFDGMEEYEKVSNAGRWQDLLETNLQLVYELLIGQYEKAISKTPDDPVLHFSLAVFYSKVHKPEAAIEEYKKAVTLNPRYKNALFNLAVILRSRGEAAEALSHYEKVLALEADDVLDFSAAFDAGLIYETLGKKEDARHSFERSLKIYPGSKEAQQKLSDLSQKPAKEQPGQ